MWREFKQFAVKGNVIDLAVGVIIGGAFGKIVTSLVNDLIMPLLGILIGGLNFTNLKIVVRPAVNGAAELAIHYGQFVQNVLDFVIIAFSIFLFVKALNKFKKKEEEKPSAPAIPTTQEILLSEIRDLLKSQGR